MRSLSVALHRSLFQYTGLSDAGGKRGDTHAGSASGGYSGGSDRDHGGNSAQTATQVRALEAAAAKAAADKMTAEKAAVEKAATVKAATDRAGDVAQRPFNQAIAAGSLTPAGVVAYQEAQKTVTPVTLPGRLLNIIEKPLIGAAAIATGPWAPVTGTALNTLAQSAGDALNARLTQAKIEKVAAESLGPDWGGSGPAVDQSGTSTPNVQRTSGGGTTTRSGISVAPLRTSAPQPMASAPVGTSGTMETPAGFSSTTTNIQPATDHGALLLGAGILAAKLLI